MRRRDLPGVALIVASAGCYAASTVLAGGAAARGAGSGLVVAARLLIAGAGLWILAALRRPARIPRTRLAPLAVLALITIVAAITFFFAIRRLGAGLATLILFLHPALVVVARVALGRDRFAVRTVAAVVMSTAGVGLAVAPGSAGVDLVGVGFGLAAALALAVYILGAERWTDGLDPVVASGTIVSFAALAHVPTIAALGIIDLAPWVRTWPWLLGMGIASAGAFSLFLAAVARLGSTRAAIGGSAEPVLAVALGVLVLGERFGPMQLAGGLLVAMAVALLPSIEAPADTGPPTEDAREAEVS